MPIGDNGISALPWLDNSIKNIDRIIVWPMMINATGQRFWGEWMNNQTRVTRLIKKLM